MKETIKSILNRKSERAPNGCLNWTGKRDRHGYGRLMVASEGGKERFTHRLAYQVANGELDPALGVLHRCDNPSCIEPSHLYQGTQAQNVRDAISRQRHAAGDRSGKSAKINGEMARAIFLDPRRQRTVAREFGLSESAVFAIRHRLTWAEATDGLVPPQYLAEKRGELHPKAKLTADLVRKIYLDPRKRSVVARAYGIGKTTVFQIWHRRHWVEETKGLDRP